MDHSRFDQIARAVGVRSTRRSAVTVLGGALVVSLLTSTRSDAKKKKKKCKKKCKDGCCTSKYGKCIQPAQQGTTQCGSGGAICQRTGCPACTASIPCPANQCCTGNGTCGLCLAFVTSSGQNGNLGGLAGADAICQARAAAAGLPGTYMAWLSDGTSSPTLRFTQAAGPYTLVDGTIIADNFNDLISGTLNAALNKTETGATVPGGLGEVFAWTNTLTNGLSEGSDNNADCANWSVGAVNQANIGDVQSNTALWTDIGGGITAVCTGLNRLYCFQQR